MARGLMAIDSNASPRKLSDVDLLDALRAIMPYQSASMCHGKALSAIVKRSDKKAKEALTLQPIVC
jgi:hypothetical protein